MIQRPGDLIGVGCVFIKVSGPAVVRRPAIEGYQVSLYTFAVSANQTPLWTISKTDDDEKFSIASVTQDGAATTFTAGDSIFPDDTPYVLAGIFEELLDRSPSF